MRHSAPTPPPLDLTEAERSVLGGWVDAGGPRSGLAVRARIVLLSARTEPDGRPWPTARVAAELGVPGETVDTWRGRFLRDRLAALSGGPEGAPSGDSAAGRSSIGPGAPAPAPAVVGLHLAPPERTLALCARQTPDNRSTDLSALPPQGPSALTAALDLTTGRVVGSLHRRHRAVHFRRFLARLDREVPAGLQVHLICDNHTTHRAPTVLNWLRAHPRFRLHAVPAGSSWAQEAGRRFTGCPDGDALAADIRAWVGTWDADPAPFGWTAAASTAAAVGPVNDRP
jgi:hypothetical protein